MDGTEEIDIENQKYAVRNELSLNQHVGFPAECHDSMPRLTPYNISREYGKHLLDNRYKRTGLSHSLSFLSMTSTTPATTTLETVTKCSDAILEHSMSSFNKAETGIPSTADMCTETYLDPSILHRKPPLHRQYSMNDITISSSMLTYNECSHERYHAYRGGTATATSNIHTSIAYNQFKHTGMQFDFYHQPPKYTQSVESSPVCSYTDTGTSTSTTTTTAPTMISERDIESLLMSPNLHCTSDKHREMLKTKLAVDTLMLEWGWSREIALAVYRRQQQPNVMRNSKVSLAEYVKRVQGLVEAKNRRLAEIAAMQSTEVHTEVPEVCIAETTPAMRCGTLSKGHPCALKKPSEKNL